MSLSNSPLAYEDAYQTMDKALADPAGIRVKYPDLKLAIHFRMRCHQARKIDREQNSLTYAKGHPLHGTSTYDKLTLRIRPDETGFWIYFERNEIDTGVIESLSDNPVVADAPSARAGIAVAGTRDAGGDAEIGAGFDSVEPIRRV